MLEYQIPIARAASGAITAACAIIALLMLSSGPKDSARTMGTVGITLVFASTVLQAVNRSVTSTYGSDTLVHHVGTGAVAVVAVGGLTLLALAIIRAARTRRPRTAQ